MSWLIMVENFEGTFVLYIKVPMAFLIKYRVFQLALKSGAPGQVLRRRKLEMAGRQGWTCHDMP
jgi:hypothetical protein